ncbi:MAG TPA: two-component regulator propeller domain-containing protein, partial [bacterium]
MMIKTFTIFLLFGFQIATMNMLQAQIDDLNLENVLVQFPNLSGTTHILQDRYGFMWFGSGTGLKKFDGYQVFVYQHDPADSLSLSDNLITALVEGKDQSLWVGTINGLNKLDAATGK